MRRTNGTLTFLVKVVHEIKISSRLLKQLRHLFGFYDRSETFWRWAFVSVRFRASYGAKNRLGTWRRLFNRYRSD